MNNQTYAGDFLPHGTKSVRIVLGFLIVYLGWGSNYVVIKLALENIQPLLLTGTRNLIAGPFLVGIALTLGQRLPSSARDWLTICLSGCCLLLFASAAVTWAQQWVDASTAAIVVASSAIWLTLLGSLGAHGDSMNLTHWISVACGLLGLALVLGQQLNMLSVTPVALALLLFAALSLAGGSLLMRRHPVGCGSLMAAGLQTCLAGTILVPLALVTGERMVLQASMDSLGALLYLAFIGTGFSYVIYCWLAVNVTPSRLGTVSYVNPAIAVLLAQLILRETFTAQQLTGSLLIVVAIFLLHRPEKKCVR